MRTRLFSKFEDVATDGVAAGFIVASLFEIIFRWHFNGSESFWFSVITDLVLLNVTHNAFSIAMLIGLPEMREWVHARTKNRPARFWMPVVLITVVMFAFFFFVYRTLSPWIALGFTILLIDLIPIHHAISQSKGLTLAHRAHLTPELSTVENGRYHDAFALLVVTSVAMVACFRLAMFTPMREFAPLFDQARDVFAVAVIGTTLYLFWMFPMWFLVRLFLWPISGFSLIAALGTRAIHGLEYFSVFRQVTTSSRGLEENRARLITVASLSIVFVLALAWLRVSQPHGGFSDPALRALASLSVSFSFAHYFLDRKMFRMRDPETRSRIGPLLLGRRRVR